MWQTIEDLKAEKETYRQRGNKAFIELQKIPMNFVEFSVYKKRQAKKQELLSEIETVKQIMGYINEAISGQS